jgi:hypothetical protein
MAWTGRTRASRRGPRERRLPREALRLHQILASGGSIQWAQQSAAAFAEAAMAVNFAKLPELLSRGGWPSY